VDMIDRSRNYIRGAQILRDLGLIEFVQRGKYAVRNTA